MTTTDQIAPRTEGAIETFRKILLAERRITKLQRELHYAVMALPEQDRPEYFRRTEELRKQYES